MPAHGFVKPFYGTFNMSWWPEIKNRVDMLDYLKGRTSYMATARVTLGRRSPTSTMIEPIVGAPTKPNAYTLTQCLLDLYKSEDHKVQFSFANVSELGSVVETLMLKDSGRIWIHFDTFPLPNTKAPTKLINAKLVELNNVLKWRQMILSIKVPPSKYPKKPDVYSTANVKQMKLITDLSRVRTMKAIFELDGYVAHKQKNFLQLMKNMIALERVGFVLKIDSDKEDKTIVKDLNATMFGLGGKFRVYLDVTPRFRQVILAAQLTDNEKNETRFEKLINEPCKNCQPMVIRKYIPCSGAAVDNRSHWSSILIGGFVILLSAL